jgi:hypothetical protein
MTKPNPSSSNSSFQRFAKLAKALAAVSKKELDEKAAEWKRKRANLKDRT